MKPGIRTTEFALSVLVLVAATALLFAGKLDADAWKWAVGLVAAGYSVSRGLAKSGS